MISVENIHLTYRTGRTGVPALRGVSIEVAKGDFLTLLGPSGCGKTTLLRCIAGLEMPDSGRITIGDEVVYSAADAISIDASDRDIGMVFQSYAIWPHMTVAQNAAFPLRYRRRDIKRSEVRDRVLRVLELVRLDGLADRPAPMLSGGQQQRLALARALISEPKVLLLDEPLSNLDARLREDMRFELRAIMSRLDVTTVFVTHEQTEALSLSDTIAVMNEGRIMQVSSPRELYTHPKLAFVATFVGRANLLPAEIAAVRETPLGEEARVSTPIGEIDCMCAGATEVGARMTLAIRPEALEITSLAEEANGAMVGTIEGVAFLGDAVECVLRVTDVPLIVKLPSIAAPTIGERVAVAVNARDCVLLK